MPQDEHRPTSAPSINFDEFKELIQQLELRYSERSDELKAVRDEIRRDFLDFFYEWPEKVDPFAYGVTDVSARVKSAKSISQNFHRLKVIGADGNVSLIPDKIYNLDNLRTFAQSDDRHTAESWCEAFGDILAVRLIARSQRGKYQMFRAVEFLCDINPMDRQHEVRLIVPSIASSGKKWKYFNPPSVGAYYSPYVVNRYHRAISGIGRLENVADDMDSNTMRQIIAGRPESLDKAQSDLVLKRAARTIESAYTLNATGIDFLMKDSGYATLQRVVTYFGAKSGYQIEIQIRTALEHCWAEPEHAMTYKGEDDPVTEEVKAIFRSYGLSLVAADDSLQMALDKHRVQNDHAADHSDRFLRPFRIQGKRWAGGDSFARDLENIYDYIRLGFIGDAIVLVEKAKHKFRADPQKLCILEIEEAICHLHNITLLGDGADIAAILKRVIEKAAPLAKTPSHKDVKFWRARLFWATFRMAHCDLLVAEFKYVRGRKQDVPGETTRRTASMRLQDWGSVRAHVREAFSSLRRVASMLADHEVLEAVQDDVDRSEAVSAEVHLLLSRAWRWLADVAEESTSVDEFVELVPENQIEEWSAMTAASVGMGARDRACLVFLQMATLEADEAIARVQELPSDDATFEFGDFNDVDLAAINSAIWCRRRSYHVRQDAAAHDEATRLVDELIKACDSSNDARRKALSTAAKRITELKPLGLPFEEELNALRVADLKILDTLIGFKAMTAKGSDSTRQYLSRCNKILTRSLVRVAARGDFAFDSSFAFALLSRPRL